MEVVVEAVLTAPSAYIRVVAKVTSRRRLCVAHATAAADVMYSVRMGRRHCMVLVKPTYLLHTTSTYLCAGMLPKSTAMYMHTYVRRYIQPNIHG
jgi:hypothetical protein